MDTTPLNNKTDDLWFRQKVGGGAYRRQKADRARGGGSSREENEFLVRRSSRSSGPKREGLQALDWLLDWKNPEDDTELVKGLNELMCVVHITDRKRW